MAARTLQFPSWLGRYPTAFNLTAAWDGDIYRLRFRWNPRATASAGGWMIDLRSKSGTPIVLGLRCVLTDDLWALFKHLDVPPGQLAIVRKDGAETDPNQSDLGNAVQFEYTPEGEVT